MSFNDDTPYPDKENISSHTIGHVKFTQREYDIISCILNGRTSKKIISSILNISTRTVITHSRNIMQKLQCTSWEYIPPFVEKYGQKQALTNHFTELLIKQKFYAVLEKIKPIISESINLKLLCSSDIDQEKMKCLSEYFTFLNITCSYTLDPIEDSMRCKTIRAIINEKEQTIIDSNLFIFNEELTLFILKNILHDKSLDLLIQDFNNFRNATQKTISVKNLPSKNIYFQKIITNQKIWIILSLLIISCLTLFFIKGFQNNNAPKLGHHIEIALPKNSFLLERPVIIEDINKKFIQDNKNHIPIVCILGMGGSGKTTISRMWRRNFIKHFPNSFTWEINAETKDSLQQSLKDLAKFLAQKPDQKLTLKTIESLPQKEEKEKQRFRLIEGILKDFKDWALIYDNVENLSDIYKFLPENQQELRKGKILITTRNSHFKYAEILTHDNIISLDKLSEDECLSLFCQLCFPDKKENLSPQEKKSMRNFISHLPPFPLDISVAARYVLSNNIEYEDYLNELNAKEKDFYTIQKNMLQETSSYTKTRYSILTLAFKKIIEENSKFEKLLTLLTMIDSQNIPYKLFEGHYGKNIFIQFLNQLKKHSLITDENKINNFSTFSIHRSTKDICNTYLFQNEEHKSENPEIIALGNTFATFVNNLIDIENYIQISLLIPHCNRILESNLLKNSIKGIISVALGWTYFCTGDDELAKKFLKNGIVSLKNKNINEKNTDDKNMLSHIDTQKYSEDIHIVQATAYLGIVYLRSGQFYNAKKLLEWSKPIYQLYNNYVEYTRVLSFLGYLYTLTGDYLKAEQMLNSSIQICKKNNIRKMNLGRAMTFFGYLNKEKGDYENAKKALNESLDLYKDKLMNAWAKSHMASLYMEMGDYERANEYLNSAISAYKEQGASNHVNLIWILPTMGSLYRKIGKYNEAEKLFKEAKNISDNHKSLSNDNFNKMFPITHLGKLYRKTGLYNQAKIYLDEAKHEHTKMYGTDSNKTLWNDVALAELYIDTKTYHEAKFLLENCLLNYQKTLSKNHYKIGKIFKLLGIINTKLGDVEKAYFYLQNASDNLKKHYNTHHLETAQLLLAWGDFHIKEKNYKKAEEYVNKSYEIFKYNNHPNMHLSLELLSKIYKTLNKKKEAKSFLKQALKISEDNFPKESGHIKRIKNKSNR